MSQVIVKTWSREFVVDRAVIGLIGVVSFIALTVAGAYIRIPLAFTPVPLTLQTFFVLLAGALLGRKLGLASMAGYLLVGIFGLPVFTGGLYGFARLFGPTGGYLIGFVLAAYIIGRLLDDSDQAGFAEIITAMFLGQVVLFTFGTFWLAAVTRVALWQAFALGVLPFLPGDLIKLVAAATVYQRVQARSKDLF